MAGLSISGFPGNDYLRVINTESMNKLFPALAAFTLDFMARGQNTKTGVK